MQMKKFCCCLTGAALAVALTACGNNNKDQQAAAPASTTEAQTVVEAAPATPAAPANPGAIKGKVLETMDASGYTYLHIDDGSEAGVWAAIPKAQLEVGEEVTLQGGSVMNNFSSKTLDRTFESIIFASGVIRGDGEVAGTNGAASFGAAVQGASAAASGGSAGNVVPFADLSVEKAQGENGYAVGELFTKREELNTKTVKVKGQVVKISRNIMGKNWIHLQDGTGDPKVNTHDLVVTTQDVAEKGDVVTIEGTVAANKDFGSGYRYDVIVEDATITK